MGFKQEYSTGLIWQDTQHRELIELLEKLSNTNADQANPKMFTYSTAFLVMYMNHHFSLEEAYMEAYGYPDTEYHKSEHKRFAEKVKSFRKKYTEFSSEASKALEEQILDWVVGHIMDNDLKLGEFIHDAEQKMFLKNKK